MQARASPGACWGLPLWQGKAGAWCEPLILPQYVSGPYLGGRGMGVEAAGAWHRLKLFPGHVRAATLVGVGGGPRTWCSLEGKLGWSWQAI